MSTNNQLISLLYSEFKDLFTPEEEEILLRSNPVELEQLYQKKRAEICNHAAVSNILSPSFCDFDTHDSDIVFFRLFSSVKNVKSRLFYAQSVSTMNAAPSHYTRRANLDSYLLTYTIKGQGELDYDNKHYVLHPGDTFLIDCRQPHYYSTASPDGWEYDIIHFNGLNMPEFFSVIAQGGTYCFSFTENSSFCKHLQELKEACRQVICSEFTINMLLTCLLTDLINETQPASQAKMPAWLEQAITNINLHYMEDMTLEALAKTVNVSKYYLVREFKRYTGQTINEYLRSVRINAAKNLLTSTNMPVSLIAEMVGYHSQYHFISLFKTFEGTTPLQYRKQWTASPLLG